MNIFARIAQKLGLKTVTATVSTEIDHTTATASAVFDAPLPEDQLSVESVSDSREAKQKT